MINRQLIVSGRVQGVGFRWSTLQIAERLGLAGWVSNQIDGTVKIRVQGPEDVVNQFIKIIKQGPTSYARVDQCKITNEKIEKYSGFTVR